MTSRIPVHDRLILVNDAARFAANTQLQSATGVEYNPETDRMQGPDDISKGCVVVVRENRPDPWDGITDERNRLLDAIKKFQAKRKTDKSAKEIDFTACEWTKVLELIQSMQKDYEKERMTGPFGSLRKCLDRLGKNGEGFKRWLDVLPDGDYGSVVSGSFKLIVETASQISDVKQCVFDAVADIPETIASAERYVEIYRAHPAYKLKQKTAALFKAILVSLRLIVGFFDQSSFGKAIKTMFKGEAHDKPLTDSISEVKKLAKNIKKEADVCLHERIRSMDQNLSDVPNSVEKLLQLLYMFLRSNPKHTIQPTSERQNNLVEAGFAEEPDCDDPSCPNNSPARMEVQGVRAQAVKPKTVLQAMEFDSKSPLNDVEHCLKLSWTLDDGDIDRASFVLKSPEVRAWLEESKHPRSLLITGNSEDSLARTSPLSLFCAHLTHWITQAKQAIVVSYFCGQRLDDLDNDNRTDARGIVISLIGQLLLQRKHKGLQFDLSFIGDKGIRHIKKGKLMTLCTIFRKLVLQIPPHRIVLCVVDGISLYELRHETDTVEVWRQLNQLQRNKQLKAVFKVLATCPGQAISLHHVSYMKGGEVMLVPDSVDGDGDGVLKRLEIEHL